LSKNCIFKWFFRDPPVIHSHQAEETKDKDQKELEIFDEFFKVTISRIANDYVKLN